MAGTDRSPLLQTFARAMQALSVHRFYRLCQKSVAAFLDDYGASMGAALAYYTLFSLAPLLLVVIAIAAMVFGVEAARGEIVAQLGGLIGSEGATAIQGLLESASKPSRSVVASILGVATLLIGATSVFSELQNALDRIWKAPALAQTSGWWSLVHNRLLSFGMVVSIGFLLLVSLAVSAALSAFGKWWGAFFPGWEVVLQVVNVVVSFAITTLLFALVYRILPRVKVTWYDVWVGSFVTALLFTVGKFLIGLYLGKTGVSSGFGAAGSIVVLLVWVYYSAQIFLLGAEFTWVFAHSEGSKSREATPAPQTVPHATGFGRRKDDRARADDLQQQPSRA